MDGANSRESSAERHKIRIKHLIAGSNYLSSRGYFCYVQSDRRVNSKDLVHTRHTGLFITGRPDRLFRDHLDRYELVYKA